MATDPAPLLDLRGFTLERRTPRGPRAVIRDIDLRLEAGAWTSLLGANGSGKSSLLKYLAGDTSPVTVPTAYMAQDPDEQLVATTVAGELRLGRPRADVPGELAAADLEGVGDLDPRLLSAGQKQRLALTIALGCRPRLLLCDEPTALQDACQVRWVLARLQRWRRETGGTLLTATCDRREAALADYLVILREGRIVARGPRQDLWETPLVQDLLLDPEADPGPRPAPPAPSGMGQAGTELLRLEGVGCRLQGPGGGFAGIDLELPVGGRLGLTGPNGCGKSTLLAVCAGLRPPDTGRVVLAGRRLYRKGGAEPEHGLALLAPQFPEYMFLRPTVAGEIALGPLPPGTDPEGLLRVLGLDPLLADRNPHDLSTGQRRRLAVGLVLHGGRPLLFLDEPTAALDRAGREGVLAMLADAPAGAGVIIASHDRNFLARAGCRILEMRPGKTGLAAPAGGC